MIFLKRLSLFPFSTLYHLATSIRNRFYDWGLFNTHYAPVHVIAIGNLTVGGTGKTPMTIKLAEYLKGKYNLAVLSRGYGRKTKGYVLADEQQNADTIGDEPFLIYNRLGKDIAVAVCEKRVEGMHQLILNYPDLNMVLLDDAYQHRSAGRNLNILLSDYSRPFYKDVLLPSGLLRESRAGAARADAIVITKCPQKLTEDERNRVMEESKPYLKKGTPVFFSTIKYEDPQPVFDTLTSNFKNIVAFSGLANAKPFEEQLHKHYHLLDHVEFNDHHAYSEKSINQILSRYQQYKDDQPVLMTTEKDMVKIRNNSIAQSIKHLPVYYLPIGIEFINGPIVFEKWLNDAILAPKI